MLYVLNEEIEQCPPSPRLNFLKGLKDGVPVCLGYLFASFTFGIVASEGGLSLWVILLSSLSCYSGTAQFAGIPLIIAGSMYMEVAVTTLIINSRYFLMSLSLSQKIEEKINRFERAMLAFGNSDEVFAVIAQQEGRVGKAYISGLMLPPYMGWFLGTLLGATVTGFLPLSVRSAFGIAVYAMFISTIISPIRKNKAIKYILFISITLSCIFYWTPVLNQLSNGWVVMICALVASTFAAWKFPVKEDE